MTEARVVFQERIAPDIYSLWLQTERIAEQAGAGQFVSLYSHDQSKLLPRPISICQIDRKKKAIRLVYRVTGPGTGTEEFSKYKEGDTVHVMGPLGNGFPICAGTTMLIGGGIGIPPMLQLAAQLREEGANPILVAGYREDLFLERELSALGTTYVATESGSAGTRGTVLDCIEEHGLTADILYACGPTPMLRAVKEYASRQQVTCYLSLEEKMACGIGACLGCVCKTEEVDEHSQVCNRRVCKDGPVFLATEVVL